MSSIIIKHNIQTEKINISFDTQDGSLSFPEVEIDIKTDIDFNELLIKMTEFIELNKSIDYEFIDESKLLDNSSKIKLIKETLEEIYTNYNNHIIIDNKTEEKAIEDKEEDF